MLRRWNGTPGPAPLDVERAKVLRAQGKGLAEVGRILAKEIGRRSPFTSSGVAHAIKNSQVHDAKLNR